MRLISRHILRALLAPFFWGLIALTGLLFLNQLAQLIDRFGGKGLPVRVMFEAIGLALPALLTLTLPMSVLVATLYAYSQLAADLEMVAMYANGLSVWRMARPALVAAACVVVVNFLIYDQMVPRSNARYSLLQNDVGRKQPTLTFRQQALNSLLPTAPYVLRANEIDPVTGDMKGVTIFDLTYDTRKVIHADSGRMTAAPNGKDLLLTLHSGEVLEYKRNDASRLEHTTFVDNNVRIQNVLDNTLTRTRDPTLSGRNEREFTGCELLDKASERRWAIAELRQTAENATRRDLRNLARLSPIQPPAVQSRPKAEPHCGGYRKVEEWFQNVMLPQKLSAQIAPTHARSQGTPQQGTVPLQQGTVAQQGTPPPPPPPAPEPQAGGAPVGAPPFLVPPVQEPMAPVTLVSSIGDVTSTNRDIRSAEMALRRYEVEVQKKIAIPLASFCFVLLGVALALKYPRSGIGLVIGASLLIFLGFYILLIGGENIAKDGYLSPVVAIQAPLVLLTVIGLIAVRSANREMGTARTAGILDAIWTLFDRSGGGKR